MTEDLFPGFAGHVRRVDPQFGFKALLNLLDGLFKPFGTIRVIRELSEGVPFYMERNDRGGDYHNADSIGVFNLRPDRRCTSDGGGVGEVCGDTRHQAVVNLHLARD